MKSIPISTNTYESPMFLEHETVEGANQVSQKVYTFIGLRHNCYCFKKRRHPVI
jgi:hypothetical protein